MREDDPNLPWYRRGKCFGDEIKEWTITIDPRQTVKSRKLDELKARMKCAGCPVVQECREDALAFRVSGVIQGGFAIPNLENIAYWKETMHQIAEVAGKEGHIGCSQCHRLIKPEKMSWKLQLCENCKERQRIKRQQDVDRFRIPSHWDDPMP